MNRDSNRVSEETKRVQESQKIFPELLKSHQSKGNFLDLLEALGAFQSGLPMGEPKQYQVENILGFIGKYQFGEPILIELGYYKTNIYYGHGAEKNYWQDKWTGKQGIDSKAKFLHSPDVQELAIREAFTLNWKLIDKTLKKQGKSLESYLGQAKTFNDGGKLKTITITLSGILAAAHLRGPCGMANLLLKNQSSHDEFSISILRYLDEYSGYDLTIEDFAIS
ncbi:hypothetical protein ACF3DV_01040 [Chlorogloeopsis fritschii PCC 9212]|uniref:Uncharacterized protein n=1 Tax=Chlorogloeopsis fritschii PCC 6912 TaxID=211165 RepID=A0A3S1A4S4_CHLFR|nr:hypothetical protein [Chlorogloeopsis fritschii]RUR80211.1 hypothetical protein PCC6912_30710 [Chlorogloeopsis fritschii PCC 6912]